MAKTKVLITVKTYPLPSRSYDELVCTAGILEDGSWIRIYPVPFKFLEFSKYQWVELDLRKPSKHDFRPESHSPRHPNLSDLQVVGSIDTAHDWLERKNYCLKNVYTNIDSLIADSKEPINKSLATFKPKEIVEFIIERDEREWKKEWIDQLSQLDLFTSSQSNPQRRDIIRKIPYKFKYHIKDENGKSSKMMIEDWEIGALYWSCLNSSNNDEEVALEKLKKKYFDEFTSKKDLYLFLGTTSEGHRRRWNNPFVIIGVFYPPKSVRQNSNPVVQTTLPF